MGPGPLETTAETPRFTTSSLEVAGAEVLPWRATPRRLLPEVPVDTPSTSEAPEALKAQQANRHLPESLEVLTFSELVAEADPVPDT